jgi:hypothetical protein
VIGRKFSEAKALASTFGQKFGDSLPESIDASTRLDSGLTVWHIDIDRPMLVSKNFIWPRGVQVVVLVNPACRFSRNFFDSLRNDKSLRKIFKNAVYLIPPHSGLQFDLVREWNRANTEFQMVLAEARRDWPDVQHWETPVFYLYSNGKLVEYIIGWPEAGNRHAIYRAFKRASAQLTGDLSLNGF